MTSPEPQTDSQESSPQTLLEASVNKGRQLRLWLAVLLLIVGATAVVWRSLIFKDSAASNPNAQQGIRVQLSPVQTGIIEDSSDFIASLESRYSIKVQPSIQGQVTQILLKLGDPVVKGTAIIEVNPRQQQAAVNGIDVATTQVAQVQLENARATLQSLQAEKLSNLTDVRLNQQDYERYASLAEQGAVPRRMVDQYANKLATTKAKLRTIDTRIQSLQAAVLQAKTSLQQSQVNTQVLQYYKIIAPFNGTIGDIPVKVGDFINPATPIATITQNQPLDVKISVPRERGVQLRRGIPVQVMDGQGQILGMSRVYSITFNPENNTQPILVKALLNNSQSLLKANQLVRARVIWNQQPGVLIPTTAVSRVAGATFVYVAQTETSPPGVSRLVARQKQVKLGKVRDNNYQVLAGLLPDEKIITSGLLNLKDGDAIAPE
ncbi:efflux RND transporter periplasmic adaptor subunit [Calothrix sp. PCC 7507]|uniref:efflux RND transporter periplasmic adaptor subunit n=1 Tax=Calothrix sp. PCC 7507 TaxID=99598 RepID=UPI00029ECC73|nr:efflux RND transporter periplasmic adaptor subunit [Calothrix sp. PCC 7507]AFY31411.1 efflux transporter, RND family, MFP subunit [Calothrix sp. PCC 7507]